jgi:hypothetical protein
MDSNRQRLEVQYCPCYSINDLVNWELDPDNSARRIVLGSYVKRYEFDRLSGKCIVSVSCGGLRAAGAGVSGAPQARKF